VSIPVNHTVPTISTIVEVRYLYAFKESGVVFQPVYLGEREDLTLDACQVTQLKFKPTEEVED
jgi:bifunctional non-homologous end joining protein LigD